MGTAKRDHRKLGQQQGLFFFHQMSPGSAFWLPHGARVYNKLQSFLRNEYHKRGYEEVVTPNVYNFNLWETSGHAANYSENMFQFEVEKQKFGLKPMNCPGHCLMFAHRVRSWRELPIRFADFGVLHRNEFSGALTGLTRVRRFQQDDAHIFCMPDQLADEIAGCLDFLDFVYGKFGFEYRLMLSTRPEKYLGEISQWDQAEAALQTALDQFCSTRPGLSWAVNPGDGAFYGPKIDIQVFDALRRRHQCATVQCDFQLPIRFGLQFATPDTAGGGAESKTARPVIVHRAILGSVERFIAILLEHTAGKWPLWVSPRQVCVVPVSKANYEYASSVRDRIHAEGFYIDVDNSDDQLKKKIRNAQLAQYNYILVVGAEEMENGTVNVRTRDNVVHGTRSIDEMLQQLKDDVAEYR